MFMPMASPVSKRKRRKTVVPMAWGRMSKRRRKRAPCLDAGADLVLVLHQPFEQLVGLHDARGAEHRRAGDAHVVHPNHRAARLAQGTAAAVGRGDERTFGGGEGNQEFLVGADVLAVHRQRPDDAHGHLGDADQVLAILLAHAIGVEAVPPHVIELRAGPFLHRLAPQLRLLAPAQLFGQLVHANRAVGQAVDQILARICVVFIEERRVAECIGSQSRAHEVAPWLPCGLESSGLEERG